MKPIKNRIFCRDCGRSKMLFETEKKALTFIKFNGQEMIEETGYAPTRAYFCIACNGYHVTSSSHNLNIKSPTEKIVEDFKDVAGKQKIQNEKHKALKKERDAEHSRILQSINELCESVESQLSLSNLTVLNETFASINLKLGLLKSMGCKKKKLIKVSNKIFELESKMRTLK